MQLLKISESNNNHINAIIKLYCYVIQSRYKERKYEYSLQPFTQFCCITINLEIASIDEI